MAEIRSQFTFYESFYKAVNRIKKKADKADAFEVLCAYALYGEEPDLDKLPDAVAVVFEMCKPNLIASRRKAESGKKGGQKKQSASTAEANASTPEAKRKQEKEQVQEKEKEQDKEQMLYTPPTPSGKQAEAKQTQNVEALELERLPVSLRDVMEHWLEYKKQRKEKYTPVGLTALISEVIGNADKYGESAVAQVVKTSMASNYKGIVFDRLQQQTGRAQKAAPAVWVAGTAEREAVKRMMAESGNVWEEQI